MYRALLIVAGLLCSVSVQAQEPSVSFIFPAGGQRGTTVEFKVGGHFLHGGCPFTMLGPGVEASHLVRALISSMRVRRAALIFWAITSSEAIGGRARRAWINSEKRSGRKPDG